MQTPQNLILENEYWSLHSHAGGVAGSRNHGAVCVEAAVINGRRADNSLHPSHVREL